MSEKVSAHDLDYNAMTTHHDGRVMRNDEKKELRAKHGFCETCQAVPVRLYTVKRNRFLKITKVPEKTEQCGDGICYVCEPYKNPNQKQRDPPMRGSRQQGKPKARPGMRPAPNPRQQKMGARNGSSAMSNGSSSGHLSSRGGSSSQLNGSSSQFNASSTQFTGSSSQLEPPASPMSQNPPIIDAVVTPFVPNSPTPTIPESSDVKSHATASTEGSQSSSTRPTMQRGAPSVLSGLTSASESVRSVDTEQSGQSSHATDIPQPPPLQATTSGSVRSVDTEQSGHSTHTPDIPQPLPLQTTTSGGSAISESVASSSSTPALLPTNQQTSMRSTMDDTSVATETSSTVNQAGSNDSLTTASTPAAPAAAILPSAPSPEIMDPAEENDDGFDDSYAQVTERIRELAGLVNDMINGGAPDMVAEIILSCMREQRQVERIQSHCLQAVWDLCQGDEQQKINFMDASAVEDIAKAMTLFPESDEIQERGCGCVWALGVNENFRLILIGAGAGSLVVEALDRFKYTPALVRSAIGALRTLSPAAEAREALSALKASNVASKAMTLHKRNKAIQRDGCAFLSNMAVNIEKQTVSVVPVEELEAVFNAMKHHMNDPTVVAGVCFALKNYCHEEGNCRSLRQLDGVEGAMTEALTNPESTISEDAGEVLDKLELCRATDESIEDQGQMELRRIADSNTESPEKVIDYLKEYDWSREIMSVGLQSLRANIGQNPDVKKKLLEGTLINDLIFLILKLVRYPNVVADGCDLLSIFEEEESERLLNARAGQLVFDGLSRHMSSQPTIMSLLSGCVPLSSNPLCWEEARVERQKLVNDAVKAFPTNETIQVAATTILSNLSSLSGGP